MRFKNGNRGVSADPAPVLSNQMDTFAKFAISEFY